MAYRNTRHPLGPAHPGSLADLRVLTKENAADLVLTNILHHALAAILKNNDLSVHRMVNPIYDGNAVTDPYHSADFLLLSDSTIVILNLTLDNGDNILRTDCAHTKTPILLQPDAAPEAYFADCNHIPHPPL